jgi:hypothetical protein
MSTLRSEIQIISTWLNYKANDNRNYNALVFLLRGANPTTVSYSASVVKFYNATSSLVRFEDINIFFYIVKTL